MDELVGHRHLDAQRQQIRLDIDQMAIVRRRSLLSLSCLQWQQAVGLGPAKPRQGELSARWRAGLRMRQRTGGVGVVAGVARP